MKKTIYSLIVIASMTLFSCNNKCGSCKDKNAEKCTQESCQKDSTTNN